MSAMTRWMGRVSAMPVALIAALVISAGSTILTYLMVFL